MREYWIVDPEQLLLTVLTLNGVEYAVAQECRPGDTAKSLMLGGLAIAFDDVLALGADKQDKSGGSSMTNAAIISTMAERLIELGGISADRVRSHPAGYRHF
ncbi:MAG: hypothetical protein R3C53_16855 [Pirellulaceae bacterium]